MSARDEKKPTGQDLLSDGWIAHLRKQRRLFKCPLCDNEITDSLDKVREHAQANHALAQDMAFIEAEFTRIKISASQVDKPAPRASAQRQSQATRKRQNLAADTVEQGQAPVDGSDEPVVKRLRSPPLAKGPRHGPSSPSTPPTAPNGRQTLVDTPEEFSRGVHRTPVSGRKLFDPATDSATRGRGRGTPKPATRSFPAGQPKAAPLSTAYAQGHARSFIQMKPQKPNSVQAREPETTPMTPGQLKAEVNKISKTIEAGQERCSKWVMARRAAPNTTITNDEWYGQWLEHRALLNNHYDLLMACQDPAGQGTLTQYPVENDVPAKLWQFGIYQYLELLRSRLPASHEPLLCFLYTAYGLLGLLRETNELFEDTWIECLGDLARYRYAIETHEETREHWEVMSRTWYMHASDNLPHVGRLYHHFAVLYRGFVVPQLCYWAKSLCVALPFDSTRASIRKLFDPLFAQVVREPFRREMRLADAGGLEHELDDMDGKDAASSTRAIHKHRMVDMTFALVTGIFFTGEHTDLLDEAQEYYLRNLDPHIARMAKRWLESGYQTGIAITCNLFGYWRKQGNGFKTMIMPEHLKTSTDAGAQDDKTTLAEFDRCLSFLVQVYETVTRRTGDTNTLPFAHTILAFLLHVSRYPDAMDRVAEHFPWELTAEMLNYWLFTAQNSKSNPQFNNHTFPGYKEDALTRPLPEDFAMRGLWYVVDYFPVTWFTNSKVELEERYFEPRSHIDLRVERVLWIARRLTQAGDWMAFDEATQKFRAADRFIANKKA